jgi:universal stress protein A
VGIVYGRILLAVDLTAESREIGRRARALADALGAELKVITVVEPVPIVTPIPPEPVGAAMLTTQADLVEIAQERIAQLARDLDIPLAFASVSVGAIKSEIIRVAADRQVDLIVIGTHERHGLAFLIRPTEDVILSRAPCDVLAVRMRGE